MSDLGPAPDSPSLSVAFGGGGVFGVAYILGVVRALEEAGIPVRSAPMLGTSAGAWAAALLATNVDFESLQDMPPIHVPNPNRGFLQRLATETFGTVTDARVTGCAVRLPQMRRVFMSGAQHRLADIVAASSSVPALFPPVRLGRSLYVDGGVRSLVSANHAMPADHLVAVAPIAGPMFGPAGRSMELMLRRELRRWQRATGGAVHLVRPNAQICALARHPLQLFDKDRAQQVFPLAYDQTRQLLAGRRGFDALCQCGHGRVA